MNSEPEVSPNDGSTNKPQWLPNWKDVAKYPDPKKKKISGRVWAWKFLRRNASYQLLWDKLMSFPKAFGVAQASSAEIEKRIELREALEREFGIRIPASPSMGSADLDFQGRPIFVDQHIKYKMKPFDWPEDGELHLIDEALNDPAEVVIWFNLRWPLDRQIKTAKKLLKNQKSALLAKKIIEKRKMLFRDYLRVLDASAVGAAPKQMAETIYGIVDNYPDHKGQQKVSAALKRAKWLRDAGFRFLIAPQPSGSAALAKFNLRDGVLPPANRKPK